MMMTFTTTMVYDLPEAIAPTNAIPMLVTPILVTPIIGILTTRILTGILTEITPAEITIAAIHTPEHLLGIAGVPPIAAMTGNMVVVLLTQTIAMLTTVVGESLILGKPAIPTLLRVLPILRAIPIAAVDETRPTQTMYPAILTPTPLTKMIGNLLMM
jgi:hypothetical protein